MLIYKITNKITGKLYIGQTVQSLKDRWNDHKRVSKTSASYLYESMRKHGFNNFEIVEIDAAKTIEGLNLLEEHYIKKFDTLAPKGYNLLPGGRNKKCHEDTKVKLSKALKGRPFKNRMNGAPKGRSVSEERRARISKTMTGVAQPWKYKAIIAIETGVVYESVNAAAKALGVNRVTISSLLKSGKQGRLGLSFKFHKNL